jgi:hypothetical protein
MGAYIRNPHDLNVRDKLNTAFSDPHLRNLRNRVCGPGASEPYFFDDPRPGNNRQLARISFRLRVWPDGPPWPAPPPPPPTPVQLRARWIHLLGALLKNPVSAAQNGTTVAEVIRDALQKFVVRDETKCTAINFEVIHRALTSPLEYQVDITPHPDSPPPTAYTALIVLVCQQDILAGAAAPDPGADPGEVPPAQPPL